VVLERHGVRFGFLGFNAIGETSEVAPGRPGAVSVSMPPRTGPLDRAELRRFLGAVRHLVLEVVFWGDQLMQAELVPYRIGPDYAPRVVPYAAAAGMFERFWRFSSLGRIAATPR
jgi:poly-gamma-glutamate synthesis protein (capsule biosynthesis protein)